MSSQPTPSGLTPPLDRPEADADYFRAINLRIIDVGVHIIEELDDPETRKQTPIKDRTDVYERTARSIRRSILMAERLAAHKREAADPARRIVQARIHLQRDVEDAITRAARSPADTESLRLELLERLEDPELDADLLSRPFAEISAEFRHDLGIPDLPGYDRHCRRTPADIAELRANAASRPTLRAARPTPTPQTRAPIRPNPS